VDPRAQQRPPGGDGADALDQVLSADVLQDVSARTGEHGGSAGLVVVVRGEHDAARVGHRGPDVAAQVDARSVGQPDVQHRHVGARGADATEGAGQVGRLADDLEVGFGVDELGDAATHDLVVVDEEYAGHGCSWGRGAVHITVVPPVSRGPIV
jgi:hypothetical protein